MSDSAPPSGGAPLNFNEIDSDDDDDHFDGDQKQGDGSGKEKDLEKKYIECPYQVNTECTTRLFIVDLNHSFATHVAEKKIL